MLILGFEFVGRCVVRIEGFFTALNLGVSGRVHEGRLGGGERSEAESFFWKHVN